MKKIGIIDSGIGGLTILDKLLNESLHAEFFYISDEVNVPYGEKTQEFMLKRTKLMVDKLLTKKVVCIVLACNTLTAETIDELRRIYKVKFIGIEPYINFINKTQLHDREKVALILTQATFKSARFQELKLKLDPNELIDFYPLKNLALIIERLKKIEFDKIRPLILEEINILRNKGYSHLILGCTHYPIIGEFLEEYLGVNVIDPHISIVKRVIEICKLTKSGKPNRTIHYNANAGDEWLHQKLQLTGNKSIFTF